MTHDRKPIGIATSGQVVFDAPEPTSGPLTEEELADIESSFKTAIAMESYFEVGDPGDVLRLVAEVRRLRAELADIADSGMASGADLRSRARSYLAGEEPRD